MTKFNNPELEIIYFNDEDIITASGITPQESNNNNGGKTINTPIH